jgi:hypothetical protein
VGDAEVKGAADDGAGVLVGIGTAEVVPEADEMSGSFRPERPQRRKNAGLA